MTALTAMTAQGARPCCCHAVMLSCRHGKAPDITGGASPSPTAKDGHFIVGAGLAPPADMVQRRRQRAVEDAGPYMAGTGVSP